LKDKTGNQKKHIYLSRNSSSIECRRLLKRKKRKKERIVERKIKQNKEAKTTKLRNKKMCK
jgi:hypothetical protein